MIDIQVQVAFTGDLEAWRRRTTTAYLRALKDATQEEGRVLQLKLRAEVTKAGLGEGVANAWRMEVNPSGARLAYEPSVFLYSRAAHIIDNFTKGEAYGPRRAQALAVPIPGSPADDLRVRPGGKRTALAEAKFGPLKVIQLKSGVAMLVGFGRDNGKGGFRSLSRARHRKTRAQFTPLNQPLVMIPLFWLVRNARLRRRLDWPRLAAEAKPAFAGRVATRLRQRFEEARKSGQRG